MVFFLQILVFCGISANLRYLYTGPHLKRRGARKKYDGNVSLQDLSRFTPVRVSKTVMLYSAVVKYLTMLKSGGSKYPIDQVREAGIDPLAPEAFELTMQRMNRVIDQIEELV